MAQKLIIEWRRDKIQTPPYIESFFCKSEKAAREIFDKRNTENIQSAKFIIDKNQTYNFK